jgi:hypothetical protein
MTKNQQQSSLWSLGFIIAVLIWSLSAAVAAAQGPVTNVNDAGDGSLRYEITNASPGDTITFDGALNGQTITLTGGEIIIDKALTIDGPGAALLTISGNNAGRIFNITTSAPVTIDGLTLQEGSAASWGGAIYSESALTLTAVSMLSNTMTADSGGYGGGAVNVDGADVAIYDSLFRHNRAVAGGSTDADAGAIWVNGNLFITNTQVISNSADDDDAAIEVLTDDVEIYNSLFRDNKALGDEFGVLEVEDGGLLLVGSQFINNNAAGDFGAVYVADDLVITNTQFISNTAGDDYGAVYAQGNITISDSLFRENAAATDVGALYGIDAVMTIVNTDFISNTAGDDNGAIYLEDDVGDPKLIISDSLFQGNEAQGDDYGAIETGGTLTLTNTNFISNTAVDDNGAVYADEETSITGGEFRGNEAGGYGGALEVNDSLVISGTQFIGNISNGDDDYMNGAGAVYAYGGDITIVNSLFQQNQALGGYDAGALYTYDTIVTITNTNFISNTGTRDDGAIFVEAYSGTPELYITGSLFQGNFAEDDFGAIESDGPVVVSDSQFIGNKTNTADVGALYADGALIITNTDFISNTAGDDNGAVWGTGNITVTNSLFQGNRADGDDFGAIESGGDLTVVNSEFIGNSAADDRGTLAVDGVTTIYDSLFQDNVAEYSYAVLEANAGAVISNTRFINNWAAVDGGALKFEADATVVNSLLAGSRTDGGRGAAIYVDAAGSAVNLKHTTIATATLGSGSALEVIAGTVNITNSIIASYTTGISNSGTVNEDYNLFAGNSADRVGVTPGAHSLDGASADAGFTDAAGGDFHLTSSSWALAKGTNAGIATDFDGDARPGGGGYDLGFDETTYTGPTAVDDTAATTINKRITLSPLSNDTKTDGDTLSIGAVGSPANGTVTISGTAQLVFTPTTNSTGTVVFTYTAREASQLEDTATITVTVSNKQLYYFPLIFNNYQLRPDLVITALNGNSGGISLTIQNNGDAPVSSDFWVDVYFNPTETPTLNKEWETIAPAGAVWGVTDDIPAGGSLTLTVGDRYYRADESSATFPDGAKVYAYVDSVNYDTTYGNVQEHNEADNLYPAAGSAGVQAAGGGTTTPGLPER